MKIYSDYTEEPKDSFEDLPQELYRELYDLEMNEFRDDLPFYLSAIKSGSKILELGCGSGRLSRLLSDNGYQVTGVDLSPYMLKAAGQRAVREKYVRMDMRRLGFSTTFDAVVIPYNSLNLLANPADTRQCLGNCRKVLRPGGSLLLHLYLAPDRQDDNEPHRTSFQFQMFDRPQGGRIIKEMKRRYLQEKKQITLTEQYKIRPMTADAENKNYSHTMVLTGWSREEWLTFIRQAGFTIVSTSAQYSPDTKAIPGLLLVHGVKLDKTK